MVTVGGGAPTPQGGITPPGAGPSGPTSFGAFCVANGGGGGAGANFVDQYGNAGPEAPPGIGDVAFPGACGENGRIQGNQGTQLQIAASGGRGGWIFGGTAVNDVGIAQASNGTDGAANTGAGGSGACVNQSAAQSGAQFYGGSGGSGLVTVTETCRDVGQPQPWFPGPMPPWSPWPMPPHPPGPWPRDNC